MQFLWYGITIPILWVHSKEKQEQRSKSSRANSPCPSCLHLGHMIALVVFLCPWVAWLLLSLSVHLEPFSQPGFTWCLQFSRIHVPSSWHFQSHCQLEFIFRTSHIGLLGCLSKSFPDSQQPHGLSSEMLAQASMSLISWITHP